MSRIKARPIILERVRQIVWETNLSYRELARLLGVSSGGMVSGWVNDDSLLPFRCYRYCSRNRPLTQATHINIRVKH